MPRTQIEILHLAFSYYPADTRVKREAHALLATGRCVAVIALRSATQPPVERCGGILAIRIPGAKTRGNLARYLRDYISFVCRCRWLVARHRRLSRVRVVHIHTLPDFLLWAALPARRRGARIVFDMHEIFPEFVRARFGGPLGWIGEILARNIERWARRRADLTITVNRPIDELIAKRAVGPEHRLVLHNTADPADFGNEASLPLRAWRDGNTVRLIYHGTLTHLYGVDVAIRGVAEARRRGVDVQLDIIGDGPDRTTLTRLARRLGLADAVRFEPPLPQAVLATRLTAYDAGVVPTRLNRMTQYSLSNKLLEYVHVGIPVLTARLPSYAAYLSDGAVWYWTPSDPHDFARVVAEFAATSATARRRRADRARAALADVAWTYERQKLLAAYKVLLDE